MQQAHSTVRFHGACKNSSCCPSPRGDTTAFQIHVVSSVFWVLFVFWFTTFSLWRFLHWVLCCVSLLCVFVRADSWSMFMTNGTLKTGILYCANLFQEVKDVSERLKLDESWTPYMMHADVMLLLCTLNFMLISVCVRPVYTYDTKRPCTVCFGACIRKPPQFPPWRSVWHVSCWFGFRSVFSYMFSVHIRLLHCVFLSVSKYQYCRHAQCEYSQTSFSISFLICSFSAHCLMVSSRSLLSDASDSFFCQSPHISIIDMPGDSESDVFFFCTVWLYHQQPRDFPGSEQRCKGQTHTSCSSFETVWEKHWQESHSDLSSFEKGWDSSKWQSCVREFHEGD